MSKRKITKIRYRFPKFHLDWKEDDFEGIFDFHQTNTFSRSQMNNRRGFTRNIHYGDILTKYGNILSDLQEVPYINKDISLLKFREESYLQNGDIIITDTAEDLTVGKAMEVQNIDEKILSGLHTILCRPKFKFAPRFFGYYLNSSSYRSNLIPLVAGVKVCSISKTNISKTLVMYPDDINEQQKIADCLSSIDDLISAEEKKLSLLNDHKKGWMQKVFPTEGKTIPEWRFPEFKDDGEWKEKKLGKACNYWNGKSHESKVNENGEYYLITLNSIDLDGNLKSEIKKITYTDYSLKKNDLIMVLSDIAHGNFLGLTAIIPNDRYVLNQRMGGLRIKDERNVNPFFICAYINYNQKYFKANGQGSSQLNLSKSSVMDFPLLLPSLPEQQKIANFLSGIDDLISKQTSKIESLKCHKKALMQGLFPTVEEILK